MRRNMIVSALALALLPCPPAAATVRQSAPASADVEALEKEFASLSERYEAAMEVFYDEYRALYKDFDSENATPEQQAELARKAEEISERDPSAQFTAEFAALAERAKGTDVAARSWLMVMQTDRGDPTLPGSLARKAFDRLLADHMGSTVLEDFAQQLAYSSISRNARIEALKKLKAESPHAPVKAACAFSLSTLYLDEEAQGEHKAQARELLVELLRDFAALPCAMMRSTYGELAARNLYELDHLQPDMQAPDFEAVDENGVKFKLSDYAGKVVVVDFWGFW